MKVYLKENQKKIKSGLAPMSSAHSTQLKGYLQIFMQTIMVALQARAVVVEVME